MKKRESAIEQRISCRSFSKKVIPADKIQSILQAGMLAPSGKNGQPWKFIVIQKNKELLNKVSALTLYDCFVKTADALIAVFLDKCQSYNYIKDCQAIGACIQNMLLRATELGIGSCWIGEILNRDIFVKKHLNIDNSLDLMAVTALGYPMNSSKEKTQKKALGEGIISYL